MPAEEAEPSSFRELGLIGSDAPPCKTRAPAYCGHWPDAAWILSVDCPWNRILRVLAVEP